MITLGNTSLAAALATLGRRAVSGEAGPAAGNPFWMLLLAMLHPGSTPEEGAQAQTALADLLAQDSGHQPTQMPLTSLPEPPAQTPDDSSSSDGPAATQQVNPEGLMALAAWPAVPAPDTPASGVGGGQPASPSAEPTDAVGAVTSSPGQGTLSRGPASLASVERGLTRPATAPLTPPATSAGLGDQEPASAAAQRDPSSVPPSAQSPLDASPAPSPQPPSVPTTAARQPALAWEPGGPGSRPVVGGNSSEGSATPPSPESGPADRAARQFVTLNALAANTEGSRAPLEGAGDTTTALALEPASEAAAQLGRQRGPGQDAAAITGTVTPAPTLVEQIVGSIQTFANRAGQGVRLRLVPEHLGEIDVKVTHRGDAITVEMFAQNATTRQAIESSLPLLRAALGEQGVQVDQFVVSGGGAFDPSGGGSTTSSWSENQPGIVPRGWANDMAGQQDGDQELPAAPERRLVDLRA